MRLSCTSWYLLGTWIHLNVLMYPYTCLVFIFQDLQDISTPLHNRRPGNHQHWTPDCPHYPTSGWLSPWLTHLRPSQHSSLQGFLRKQTCIRLHQISLSPSFTACQYYPSQLWSLIWLHMLSSHTWERERFALCFVPPHHLCDELHCSPHITSDTLKWTKIQPHSTSVMTVSPGDISGQDMSCKGQPKACWI